MNYDAQQENLDAVMEALTAALQGVNVELRDTYDLPNIRPIEGRRYFGIKCGQCGIISPAFADPSNGKLAHPFTGKARFKIKCYARAFSEYPHELEAGVDGIVSIPWP